MNKVRIVVAIGTNTQQEQMMQKACDRLSETFDNVRFSSAIWTEPIGIRSDMFLNRLTTATTTHDADKVTDLLKKIEAECGDTKGLRAGNKVLMDLDIMMYDGRRMHENDWNRPYVYELMKEIGI